MVLRKFESYQRIRPLQDDTLDRILYVEDEDANWNVTELHLRGKYAIKRARNSRETFDLLRKENFDIILLDIQLADSEFDGIEICKIIKHRPGQLIPLSAKDIDCTAVPVVFVTAYAERYTKEMLLKAGGDDVITKPVDFTRLRLVSSRLLVKSLLR